MLISISVTSAKKNIHWIGRTVMINTERISFLETNGSGAKFKYVTNPYNSRGIPDVIETASSVTTLNNAMKAATLTTTMYLPIYPDEDTTKSLETKYILYRDYAFGFVDPLSATRTYAYLNEGTRMRRVLVNLSLAKILNYTVSATTAA